MEMGLEQRPGVKKNVELSQAAYLKFHSVFNAMLSREQSESVANMMVDG